jgi:hypothetical protein
MAKVTDNIVNGLNKAFSNVKFADTTEKMKTLSQMKNSIEEEDVETTEATGSGSSGQYSGPLFSEPVKNTLFQPGTEMNVKTKPKGGFVKEEEIEGGKAQDKSLMDLAKKHTKDRMTQKQSPERIEKMYDHLERQLKKGIKVEMEHSDNKKIAKEITMDHLAEDPNYYNKLAKIHREGEKVEATEATGASSAGQYSQPAFLAANSKNWGPSKNTQIPGGKFVKVKEKCKRFPYCNQGDINSIEMWESKMVQDALLNVSKNTGLSQDYIKSLVESQLNKKDYRKIVKEDESELVSIDMGEPSKKTSFEDLIQDKKAKLLIDKFQNQKFEFNYNNLSGKFTIMSIGPVGKNIGFGASIENFNFSKTQDVQILIDLSELKFKGEKVPVGFYNMISRYLPPEDEEESYRGDPVESAVMSGLDKLQETLKYMNLNLVEIRINPYYSSLIG